MQAYVLNFNGRVDQASVKNFQLVDKIDGKYHPVNSKFLLLRQQHLHAVVSSRLTLCSSLPEMLSVFLGGAIMLSRLLCLRSADLVVLC